MPGRTELTPKQSEEWGVIRNYIPGQKIIIPDEKEKTGLHG